MIVDPAILNATWFNVVEALWYVWNENRFDKEEDDQMTEKIIWYVQNKQDILATDNQFLA